MKLQINENNDDQFADVNSKSPSIQMLHIKTQLKSLDKERQANLNRIMDEQAKALPDEDKILVLMTTMNKLDALRSKINNEHRKLKTEMYYNRLMRK